MTMACVLHHLYLLFALVTVFSLLSYCSSQSPTVATWYGNANGAGTDGGACGYGATVEQSPCSKLMAAGGSSLFKSGQGCGACYQVKCTSKPACSGNPLTVTITDLCPGSCGALQFDLSGTAFGALAAPGKADQLRSFGKLDIQYQRVPCRYPGLTVTFHVDARSNPYYFATVIQYEGGDGDLAKVEVQQGSSWLPVQHSWGATWKINSALQAPFSIRLTTLASGKTLVANKVIPAGWNPGGTYRSNVQI